VKLTITDNALIIDSENGRTATANQDMETSLTVLMWGITRIHEAILIIDLRCQAEQARADALLMIRQGMH
jgi:hypothetical protein